MSTSALSMALTDAARARIIIAFIREATAHHRSEDEMVNGVKARLQQCRIIGAKQATSRIADMVRRLPNTPVHSARDWKLTLYDAIVAAGTQHDPRYEKEEAE